MRNSQNSAAFILERTQRKMIEKVNLAKIGVEELP
jgi:hypothetical protein